MPCSRLSTLWFNCTRDMKCPSKTSGLQSMRIISMYLDGEVKCSLEGLLSAEKINGWMLDLLVSSNQQNSNEIQQKGIPCRTWLVVYLDEVTEYSRPSHQVGVCQKGITRWELSIEAALPEDLTEKETVKRFLHELWKYSIS